MNCPMCLSNASKVVDSRVWSEASTKVYRRRRCEKCSHRWSTFEIEANHLERLEKTAGIISGIYEFADRLQVAIGTLAAPKR